MAGRGALVNCQALAAMEAGEVGDAALPSGRSPLDTEYSPTVVAATCMNVWFARVVALAMPHCHQAASRPNSPCSHDGCHDAFLTE